MYMLKLPPFHFDIQFEMLVVVGFLQLPPWPY